MTKFLFLLTFIIASLANAQAVRVDPQPTTTVATNVPGGAMTPLLAIPGVQIQLCAAVSGTTCTTVAATYTDESATTTCPSTQQVVLSGTDSCVGTSDAQGNFGFWVAEGSYWVFETLPYSGVRYGPFPFTALGPNEVSVLTCGADQSGTQDSTAAFQKCVDTGHAVFIPNGTYKISNVHFHLSSATNTLADVKGESMSGVVINQITGSTHSVFYYNTSGSFYGNSVSNMSINAVQGAGCVAYGDIGEASYDVVNAKVRRIKCTGQYSNGGSVSIDPNYRTRTESSAATMAGYGTGIVFIHALDITVENCTFLQNGVDIWEEGSDLNKIDTNRSQASGWFFYTVDGSTFGNMNRIDHNDILINGGAGGAIQLNGSYYYQIYGNYYENLYASTQFINTVSDRNTAFFNNKYNFTPTVSTTANTELAFAPQRTDWIMNGNVSITNANAVFANGEASCTSTYFANATGSNERGSYLCVVKDNNIGFPAFTGAAIATGDINPDLLSYDNPQVLGGSSASSFPWVTSATTGQYVIDISKSYTWTWKINQSFTGYQNNGSFQFDLKINARATVNPSNSFMAVDYCTDSQCASPTRVWSGYINWTNTAWPEIRDIVVQLPYSSLPANAWLNVYFPNNTELQSAQFLPVQTATVFDEGNVSGTYTIYLSNYSPVQKLTLTGDVTTIALSENVTSGIQSFDGKITTFEICQDATGGRAWPIANWGGTYFAGAFPISTSPNVCSTQTFRWSSSLKKYLAIGPITNYTTTGTLFYQSVNNYHFHFSLVANGTSGCTNAAGCFLFTGPGNSGALNNVTASLNTSIGLFTLQAGYIVTGLNWNSSTGCSGGSIATATIDFGTSGTPTLFGGPDNIFTASTYANHPLYASEGGAVSGSIVAKLIATGDTWDHATTCSADVYVKIEQKQ